MNILNLAKLKITGFTFRKSFDKKHIRKTKEINIKNNKEGV